MIFKYGKLVTCTRKMISIDIITKDAFLYFFNRSDILTSTSGSARRAVRFLLSDLN